MGTVGLVVAVAVIAGLFGYMVGRRNPRRARRVFVLGFLAGSVAGSVLKHHAARRRLVVGVRRRILQ